MTTAYVVVLKTGAKHKMHGADPVEVLNTAWRKYGAGRVSQVFEATATKPESRKRKPKKR